MKNKNLPSYVIAIILAVMFIYPLYILILIAFEPISLTFDRLYPYQLPFVFTLKNFESSIKNLSLIKPVIRSVIVAFTVGFLALVLATPAGYGLNKLSARFSNKIIMLLFVVNMMPAIVIAIPISVYFIKIGLYICPYHHVTAAGCAVHEVISLRILYQCYLGSYILALICPSGSGSLRRGQIHTSENHCWD